MCDYAGRQGPGPGDYHSTTADNKIDSHKEPSTSLSHSVRNNTHTHTYLMYMYMETFYYGTMYIHIT